MNNFVVRNDEIFDKIITSNLQLSSYPLLPVNIGPIGSIIFANNILYYSNGTQWISLLPNVLGYFFSYLNVFTTLNITGNGGVFTLPAIIESNTLKNASVVNNSIIVTKSISLTFSLNVNITLAQTSNINFNVGLSTSNLLSPIFITNKTIDITLNNLNLTIPMILSTPITLSTIIYTPGTYYLGYLTPALSPSINISIGSALPSTWYTWTLSISDI